MARTMHNICRIPKPGSPQEACGFFEGLGIGMPKPKPVEYPQERGIDMNRRNVTSMFGFTMCGAVLILCWVSASANAQSVDGKITTASNDGLVCAVLNTNSSNTIPIQDESMGQAGIAGKVESDTTVSGSTNSTETVKEPEKAPPPPLDLRVVVNQ